MENSNNNAGSHSPELINSFQSILANLDSCDDSSEFTRKLFETQTIETIKEVVTQLEQRNDKTTEQLKERVFTFYPCFISGSKHVQLFEQSITTLRGIFSEQKEVLQDLKYMPNDFAASAPIITTPLIKIAPLTSNFDEEEKFMIYLDELDELITNQSFEEAIKKINDEKKQRSNSTFQKLLNNRTETIAQMLLLELKDTSLRKLQFQRVIQYLNSLGYENWASETFLQTKMEILSKKIRELRVENDITIFIRKLSMNVFHFIGDTFAEYQFSFPFEHLLSAFIVWAKRVLDLFYSSFSRHVFSANNQSKLDQCTNIAYEYCDQLEKSGLPLSFYLNYLFSTPKNT